MWFKILKLFLREPLEVYIVSSGSLKDFGILRRVPLLCDIFFEFSQSLLSCYSEIYRNLLIFESYPKFLQESLLHLLGRCGVVKIE